MTFDLRRLASTVEGNLSLPGERRYEESRRLWNRRMERHPLCIVHCRETADAVAGVRFAAEHSLPVSIYGGGHHVGCLAAGNGSVMLHLGAMQSMTIDDAARTMTCGGGATWGGLAEATAGHDFTVPGGFNPNVGVAGLTLGGGYGPLVRLYGLACDSLLAADLVTADGKLIEVSEEAAPDLLWALRGAGANFGVVTRLRLQMHPVPPIFGGVFFYPWERSRYTLRAFRDFVADAPHVVVANAGLQRLQNGEARLFVVAGHLGPLALGPQALAPLAARGMQPLASDARPLTYLDVLRGQRDALPAGCCNYWRSHFARELSDALIDSLVDCLETAGELSLYVAIEHLGGALALRPADATAFPHRGARYGLALTASWQGQEPAARHISAVELLHRALAPYTTGGAYVNYVSDPATNADLHAAYGVNLARLRALKAHYDPANRFRCNVNIAPRSGDPVS